MGAQRDDEHGPNHDVEARYNEGPVRNVAVSSFLVGKYEVTQAQWLAVMQNNPAVRRIRPDLPITNVSWDDCQAFCLATELRLPTETEWEYACRAGSSGPRAGSGDVAEREWFEGNSGGQAHPVGQKAPNGFGLHDILGNVAEWSWSTYECIDEGERRTIGEGQAEKLRVLRGTDSEHPMAVLRCAQRAGQLPTSRWDGVGFRAAASFPGS